MRCIVHVLHAGTWWILFLSNVLSRILYVLQMKVFKKGSNAPNLIRQQQISSEAIDFVRFPLAVMVVFIHSFPDGPNIDFTAIDYGSLSPFDAYNVLRRFCSNIFPSIAVPSFFFISGYLFFKKLEEWNWNVWKRKIRSRVKTLVIPYFLWVTIYILYMTKIYYTIGAIIINGRSTSLFTDWFCENGGLHMFWDLEVWGNDALNWFGGIAPHMTGPYLIPLWFLRDLMVVVAITPIIYYLIKKTGIIPIIILGIAYITKLWPDIHGLTTTAAFFFSAGAYISVNGQDVFSVFYKYRKPVYCIWICMLIVNMYLAVGAYTDLRLYFSGLYVFAGVISALNIAYWLIRYKGFHSKRLLVDSCFFIYAFHAFFLGDCKRIVEVVVTDSTHFLVPFTYLLFPWIDIAFCILLYYILHRFLPKITSVLTGGR